MSKLVWLDKAVFYNIYPQSFYDSNGDGIGDLNGIAEKLDYIKEMGFNAIWLNPIYDSTFRDAGYDVTDFYKVAPRYGTNDDFKNLASEAKKRGIKVVLDLLAGHTSLECEWFKQSSKAEKNKYSNRYIWSDSVWDNGDDTLIGGYSERDGCYMKNFFYCQPALNYGFKNIEKSWQLPMNHPDCLATREELLNIMRFWSKLGADGFRVDMAASLIKNDPNSEGIVELWNDISGRFKKEFPESVLISEWCYPKTAIEAGFDIDFLLHFRMKSYTTLFRYEKGTNQGKQWIGNSYFRAAGQGDINEFLDEYLDHYENTKEKGYISIPTGNHDMQRISLGRSTDELKIAYTFLLTMPGVPFVYYGDEIGMKNIDGLPSKEGGYNRTGARTPMQWAKGKNLGFSNSDTPYLPTDNAEDAPTVEDQLKNENSLLNHVRNLIKIRCTHSALCADGGFETFRTGYPFIYKRFDENETLYVAVNPSKGAVKADVHEAKEILLAHGMEINEKKLTGNGLSYIIYKG
ncbi:MAG: alpha-amylase family glycosyl hydrolase [Firmicutes bacterium]|nr:alpha-amylase family glycosyl hydrolase [Bacillota bacterium]